MQTTDPITFTKLRSGEWGIRSKQPIAAGEVVEVVKRDGSRHAHTVTKIVWTDKATWLAAIDTAAPARPSRGRRTGCSCGSREDHRGALIASQSNCWSCNFDEDDC